MQRGLKTIGNAGISNNVGGLTNFFGDGSDGAFNPATILSTGTTAPNGGTVANLWDMNAGTIFTTSTLSNASDQVLFQIDFSSQQYLSGSAGSSPTGMRIFVGTISVGTRTLSLQWSDNASTWTEVGTTPITTADANSGLSGGNQYRRYWRLVLKAGGSNCTFSCQGVAINYNGAIAPFDTQTNFVWRLMYPVTIHSGIVIKQYSSLTLPAGYAMTTDSPCRGLIIYCQGNADITGTIDMSQKAGLAPNGEVIPMLVTKKGQYNAKTSSLLHFNNSITDDNGKVWTNNGAATFDSTNKKFGSHAISLNGTNQWIDTPASDDFSFGSGDFTIDFWMRPNSFAALGYVFGSADVNTAYGSIGVATTTTPRIRLIYHKQGDPSQITADGTTSLNTATWYHVAIVKYGEYLKLYLNGNAEISVLAQGMQIQRCLNKFAIGRAGEYTSNNFNGWIDEFRVVKGKAMYTANFTPPVAEYTYTATYTDTPKTLEKYYQLTTVLQALRGGYGGNGGYGGGSSFSTGRQTQVGIGGSGRLNAGGFGGGGSGGAASDPSTQNMTGGQGGSILYSELGGGVGVTLSKQVAVDCRFYGLPGSNGSGGGGGMGSGTNVSVSSAGGSCFGGGGGGSGGCVSSGSTSVGSNGQYSGGLIEIVCGNNITINSGGVLSANGGNGGNGAAGNYSGGGSCGGGGGGGGSGGGVIALFYKGAYTNNGTVQSNGGVGGSGGALGSGGEAGGAGTSGSAGTIHTQQIA
ncbi:LamG domain-containing protein [Cohnella silvisoli]|uniref:LamG domain-containing protein n=1 Tax=Cohnella silvisoli TaxID=2873699 RepID=A0ABV1L0C5_9BACL|nr:LamG domain-containing protein [Cohnella silvisoli]MCD9024303.1 LamG domain-containing protein [Cohnella silvisoli]